MKNYAFLISSIILCSLVKIEAQIPSNQDQINAAIQTLPENLRAGATVLGFSQNGELIELRKGTNEQICLADDPNKPGYNAACYHKDLSPFMSRRRALRAEGKSRKEIDEIGEQEAKAGKIKMPTNPSTLHIMYGKEAKYNTETGLVENANYRYVVYIPWATPESTGLPTAPMVQGGAWIMDPGTHKAHIMITPPRQN